MVSPGRTFVRNAWRQQDVPPLSHVRVPQNLRQDPSLNFLCTATTETTSRQSLIVPPANRSCAWSICITGVSGSTTSSVASSAMSFGTTAFDEGTMAYHEGDPAEFDSEADRTYRYLDWICWTRSQLSSSQRRDCSSGSRDRGTASKQFSTFIGEQLACETESRTSRETVQGAAEDVGDRNCGEPASCGWATKESR